MTLSRRYKLSPNKSRVLLHATLNNLKDFQCLINDPLYTEIFRSMLYLSEFDQAHILFTHLQSTNNIIPKKLIEYMIMIYGKANQLELAEHLFIHLSNNNLTDEYSYYVMISATQNSNNIEATLKYYNEMRNKGYSSLPETYLSIYKLFVSNNNIEEARKVYHQLILDFNNINSYNTCLQVLVNNGLVDEAFSVFKDITENGLNYDEKTFYYMIYGLGHLGKEKEAMSFYNQMQNTNLIISPPIYDALVFPYLIKGRIKEAVHIFLKGEKIGLYESSFVKGSCNIHI